MPTSSEMMCANGVSQIKTRLARACAHAMSRMAITIALATSLHAQCPEVNFIQRSGSSLYPAGVVGSSGLQRIPDGSFSRQTYDRTAPYARANSSTGFQTALLACTNRPPTTPTPPASRPLLTSDMLGTASRNPVNVDLANNGTATLLLVGNAFVDQLFVGQLNADTTTKSTATYAVGTSPSSILTADFNGDGKRDVAVISSPGGGVGSFSILLGNGNGTLQNATTRATAFQPGKAAAIDLNADSKIDLVIVNQANPGAVFVYLGNGDGTFQNPVSYQTGAFNYAIAIADVNGDSRPDIVTASPAGSYSILLGNGNGTFATPTTVTTDFTPSAVVAADFNKDGKVDLVFTDLAHRSAVLLLGAGNGTFSNQKTYLLPGDDLGNVFGMDFDWDGNLDIVVASGHPEALTGVTSEDVYVLFGRGDGTFYGAPGYPTDLNPQTLVTADFNGDGKPDLAAANQGSNVVTVMLGSGGDVFQTPVSISISGASGLTSIASGDLNADGKIDLVVTDVSGVFVLLGNGTGGFQAAVKYPAGLNPVWVAVGDVNGDGKPDLAVVNGDITGIIGGGVISILLNNGSGAFGSPTTFTPGSKPVRVALADLNADGKRDLIVLNSGTAGSSADPGGVSVLLGNGNGTFQTATNYPSGLNPAALLVGDVNGDGKPDLLVAGRVAAGSGANQIAVFLGTGSGTFAAPQIADTSFGPINLAIADLNQDGKQDIIVAHCCGLTDMTYLLGTGNGTFPSEVHFPVGYSPYGLVTADFNADGRPDLAISHTPSFGKGLIGVLTNITGLLNPQFALSVTKNGAGTGTVSGGAINCGATCSANFDSGTVVVLTATPAQGSTFAGWSGACTGVGACSVTMDAAKSVTATFNIQQFALTVAKNGAGTGTVAGGTINCGATCSANFDSGTLVTLTATPAQGSNFAGWSGACTGTAACSVTMDAAKSVTATFNIILPQFALTVTRNGTGSGTVTGGPINCGTTCSANVDSGTLVALTATPAQGSSFAGWSGACTGSAGCSVTMDAAKSVTATFTSGPPALQLITVAPCRVFDSRNANGPLGGPFLGGGSTRTIPVPTSLCGVPANAAAYSLNITVVPKTGTLGYLTVWPAGQSQPNVSTLNAPDGSILANAAIVPAGTAGAINAFALNDTDLIVDVNGYFVSPAGNSLQFFPITPCRVFDTRNANGPFGGPAITGGASRSVPVPTSTCGVPASAAAYSLNVTAVPQGFLGFATAFPTGQSLPNVSTLNSLDGTVLANAAIVPAGTNGAVSFYANNTTNLVVDINGYFAPATTGGKNFFTATPCRLVDTRNGNGSLGGPIMAGSASRTFPLPTSSCGLPSAAAAYSLNVTVAPSGPLGFLTAWPTGLPQPPVSTLNAPKGFVVANAALVPAGTSGSVDVFVLQSTHVIIDTNGYFQ